MIRITPKQVAALSDAAVAGFLDRVVAFLQEHFPDAAGVAATELRSEIRPVLRKAYDYGLETEDELVSFLLAAKEFGSRFDQDRAVRSLLTSQMSSAEKAMLLDCMVLLGSAEGHAGRRAA